MKEQPTITVIMKHSNQTLPFADSVVVVRIICIRM